MSLGGVTSTQESEEKFCRCLGIAGNGVIGVLSLKSSLTLFSVIDIFLGVFAAVFLLQEVIWEWEYFNASGPFYFLTTFYFLRVARLFIGIVGLVGVQKQSARLAGIYSRLTLVELAVFPLLGILSSYDMCRSWLYRETCP